MLGAGLGVWHFQLGLRGFMVFRAHEPVSSWLVMLCGLFLTLPASLLGLGVPVVAGLMLLGGAVTSTAAFAAFDGAGVWEGALYLGGPMLLI